MSWPTTDTNEEEMEPVTECTGDIGNKGHQQAEEDTVVGMVTPLWDMVTTTSVAKGLEWEMARQELRTQKLDVLSPTGNIYWMSLHLILFLHWCFHLIQGCPTQCLGCQELLKIFEEWLPRGICVEFKSMSSDNPNTAVPALGTVVIATQYNSSNPDFVNKSQMENYEFATSCKPSRSMLHCVETARSQTIQDEFYTRTGPLGANQDIKFYDLGKTQVSVVGAPTAANGSIIGELWITYEIELRKPKIPTDPVVQTGHIIMPGDASANDSAPFGSTVLNATSGSSMAISAGGPGQGNLLRFGANARGLYMVILRFRETTAGNQGAWTITPANCAVQNAWENNTLPLCTPNDAGTTTLVGNVMCAVVNITGNNASLGITLTSTQTGATVGFGDCYVIEMNDTTN